MGNYIKNAIFKKKAKLVGKGLWHFYPALVGEAKPKIQDKKFYIITPIEGTPNYMVHLVHPPLPLKKGAPYNLTFDAYANQKKTIKTELPPPNHDYNLYLENTK